MKYFFVCYQCRKKYAADLLLAANFGGHKKTWTCEKCGIENPYFLEQEK